MSRDTTWANPDGLVVGYGRRTQDNHVPRVVAGPGAVKYMEVNIQANRLDPFGTVTTAFLDPQAAVIRRGSRILRAGFEVNVAFAGATAVLLVGTYKADGTVTTVDDLDGILNATDGAVANLNGIGEVTAATGALVGAVATTAGAVSDSDVVVVAQCATAQFTAGSGTLWIEYLEPVYTGATAPAYTN